MADGDEDEPAALREPINHVVASNIEGGHQFECLRCKRTYVPALPCSIDMFVTMGDQFVKEHEDCERQEVDHQRG